MNQALHCLHANNSPNPLVSSRDESKKVFFITFGSPDGATAAVASDGTQFDGVEIAVSLRVDGYTNDPVAVDPCRIFVGRLTSEIDGADYGDWGRLVGIGRLKGRGCLPVDSPLVLACVQRSV